MRWLTAVLCCVSLTGCWSSGGKPQVVAYTVLDQEFSEPIFADFTKETGIQVLPKFDTESTKTVGLTAALEQEANRPRCDVFWNNEIINTLRLEQKGLLDVYRSPVGESYPEMFRGADGTWHGFAARARILIVNTKLVDEAERPKSIYDLIDPKWKGKIGIAKPLAGTTATHAACLFQVLGQPKAEEFFLALKDNGVQILEGNKQVALAAASGQISFGLTDTDDAMGAIDQGHPVTIVYPDRAPDQLGTLFIPNTVAIIKGCPHPQEARRLVDYILSPAVEEKLALGESAQIPLNPAVKTKARVETPATVKAMPVDFSAATKQWDQAAKFVREKFATAN
jgi:iron(III) transport system substrate-binding protein